MPKLAHAMTTLSRTMGLLLLGTALVLVAPLAQAQDMPAPSPENPEAVEEAREAAEQWLALTDEGAFAESWDEASELLQDEITKEEWTQGSEEIQAQLGTLEEREFMGGQYQEDIPEVPDGEFVIMQYQSSFSGPDGGEAPAQELIEVVVATNEDGTWRIAGYDLRPAGPQQPQQPQPEPQPQPQP